LAGVPVPCAFTKSTASGAMPLAAQAARIAVMLPFPSG
jgi:hypothetical protein